MSKWTEIDYSGREQVNFETMQWRWAWDIEIDGNQYDVRDLKRVSATNWLIKNDQDNWSNFTVDDPIETETLESFYELYCDELANQIILEDK